MYRGSHSSGLGGDSGRFPRSPTSFPAGRSTGGGVSVREVYDMFVLVGCMRLIVIASLPRLQLHGVRYDDAGSQFRCRGRQITVHTC